MLYQTIRPTTFDDILGNAAAVECLKVNLLKPQTERPHVYGMIGPAGCGKTTLARIAAQLLGANIGIREVNVGETRGIETAREIVEQMKFSTFDGTPQVWIFDECHKATADFWGCMLKPLEDTPKHVYVFLCTTEGNKIPAAIRTRTKLVTVEAQKEDALSKWLRIQANKHQWSITRPLLELIAECSNGSPRQALQHVESVLGVEDETTAKAIIRGGSLDEAETKNLASLLIKPGPWKPIADALKLMKDKDAEGSRRGIMGYCQAILMNGRDDQSVAAVLEVMCQTNCYDGMPVFTMLCYQANKAVGHE